jgi:hypothetical protein
VSGIRVVSKKSLLPEKPIRLTKREAACGMPIASSGVLGSYWPRRTIFRSLDSPRPVHALTRKFSEEFRSARSSLELSNEMHPT